MAKAKKSTEELSVEVQNLIKEKKELEQYIETKTLEFSKDFELKTNRLKEIEANILNLNDFIERNEVAKIELEEIQNKIVKSKEELNSINLEWFEKKEAIRLIEKALEVTRNWLEEEWKKLKEEEIRLNNFRDWLLQKEIDLNELKEQIKKQALLLS